MPRIAPAVGLLAASGNRESPGGPVLPAAIDKASLLAWLRFGKA